MVQIVISRESLC
ncbi:mCG9345, isoform CRA_f [Mus musculus]|uniref:Chromosome transmission fidelity factor 8 n=13 Tax=Eutheria TaxID=9347 RepID=A0A2K5QNM3_CEBIM|nr:mCG9345, isoform CRA_f [Mus musculus]